MNKNENRSPIDWKERKLQTLIANGNQGCPTTNQISIFHISNKSCGPSREVIHGTMKLKIVAHINV